MQRLLDVTQEFSEKLKNGDVEDNEFYVVLTNRSDSSSSLSSHVSLIARSVQFHAGVIKMDKQPFFVICNQAKDVPKSKRDVSLELDLGFLNMQTKLTKRRHNEVFDNRVLNMDPFIRVDEFKIQNCYGPYKEVFDVDPENHDVDHSAISQAYIDVTINYSRKFSNFQKIVFSIICSKFCPACLECFLKCVGCSAMDAQNVVAMVLDGLEVPVDTEDAKEGWLWLDDEGKPCEPQLFREKMMKDWAKKAEIKKQNSIAKAPNVVEDVEFDDVVKKTYESVITKLKINLKSLESSRRSRNEENNMFDMIFNTEDELNVWAELLEKMPDVVEAGISAESIKTVIGYLETKLNKREWKRKLEEKKIRAESALQKPPKSTVKRSICKSRKRQAMRKKGQHRKQIDPERAKSLGLPGQEAESFGSSSNRAKSVGESVGECSTTLIRAEKEPRIEDDVEFEVPESPMSPPRSPEVQKAATSGKSVRFVEDVTCPEMTGKAYPESSEDSDDEIIGKKKRSEDTHSDSDSSGVDSEKKTDTHEVQSSSEAILKILSPKTTGEVFQAEVFPILSDNQSDFEPSVPYEASGTSESSSNLTMKLLSPEKQVSGLSEQSPKQQLEQFLSPEKPQLSSKARAASLINDTRDIQSSSDPSGPFGVSRTLSEQFTEFSCPEKLPLSSKARTISLMNDTRDIQSSSDPSEPFDTSEQSSKQFTKFLSPEKSTLSSEARAASLINDTRHVQSNPDTSGSFGTSELASKHVTEFLSPEKQPLSSQFSYEPSEPFGASELVSKHMTEFLSPEEQPLSSEARAVSIMNDTRHVQSSSEQSRPFGVGGALSKYFTNFLSPEEPPLSSQSNSDSSGPSRTSELASKQMTEFLSPEEPSLNDTHNVQSDFGSSGPFGTSGATLSSETRADLLINDTREIQHDSGSIGPFGTSEQSSNQQFMMTYHFPAETHEMHSDSGSHGPFDTSGATLTDTRDIQSNSGSSTPIRNVLSSSGPSEAYGPAPNPMIKFSSPEKSILNDTRPSEAPGTPGPTPKPLKKSQKPKKPTLSSKSRAVSLITPSRRASKQAASNLKKRPQAKRSESVGQCSTSQNRNSMEDAGASEMKKPRLEEDEIKVEEPDEFADPSTGHDGAQQCAQQ